MSQDTILKCPVTLEKKLVSNHCTCADVTQIKLHITGQGLSKFTNFTSTSQSVIFCVVLNHIQKCLHKWRNKETTGPISPIVSYCRPVQWSRGRVFPETIRLWVRTPAKSYQRLGKWYILPCCLVLSVQGWHWGLEGMMGWMQRNNVASTGPFFFTLDMLSIWKMFFGFLKWSEFNRNTLLAASINYI